MRNNIDAEKRKRWLETLRYLAAEMRQEYRLLGARAQSESSDLLEAKRGVEVAIEALAPKPPPGEPQQP